MTNKLVLRTFFCLVLTLLSPVPYRLQSQTLSAAEIKKLATEKFPEALDNLSAFLKLPNDGHDPDQVSKNLFWCDSIFKHLNFETQVISTEGAPLLFAQKRHKKNAKTVLFYLQIDGQPVDTSKWDQADPFLPVLKRQLTKSRWQKLDPEIAIENFDPDWRIFARSASDSKGPATAFISSLEIMNAERIKSKYNIKVIMDFQEEMGSPHLPNAVKEHRNLLNADFLFIMDGTRHLSNWPTLTYGARGIATASLRIFGPRYPLHSGQYGNFAPNPVFEAGRLIGSLKDAQGRVIIPGFYEGIQLSSKEKDLLNSLPDNEDSLKNLIGIAKADAVGNTYQEALQYPTLNIRGLRSAWVGSEVRTVIPDEVLIEFDLRLVPESDGEHLISLLRNHIKGFGYHLVDSIPTEHQRQTYSKLAAFNYRIGSRPFRTDMDAAIGQFLNKAMFKVFGDRVINMRTTGGSQPMAPFVNTLAVPAVSIRIPNPDNNIHAPNENLRLGNYLEGIIMCLAILNEPIAN